MADLTWPDDLEPIRASFYLQPHVGGTESPMTRTRKVYGLSAPRWICRLTFIGGHNGYDGFWAQGARLDALIVQMQGGLNRMALWDFRRPSLVAIAGYYSQFAGQTFTFTGGETFDGGEVFVVPTTQPVNAAASAGATSMTFTASLPEGTRVFNAGDYFGGDGRVHMVLENAGVNSDGSIPVTFEPPLATALAAGAAVTIKPTSMFRLANETAGENESQGGQPTTYTLEFVEDL